MERHGIQLDSPEIREFCRKWKIIRLEVFGSILRHDFRPDSDVDFLVEYDDSTEWDLFDSFRMEEDLERILGRPVDIVDRFAIEHTGNQFVRQEILSTTEAINVGR